MKKIDEMMMKFLDVSTKAVFGEGKDKFNFPVGKYEDKDIDALVLELTEANYKVAREGNQLIVEVESSEDEDGINIH